MATISPRARGAYGERPGSGTIKQAAGPYVPYALKVNPRGSGGCPRQGVSGDGKAVEGMARCFAVALVPLTSTQHFGEDSAGLFPQVTVYVACGFKPQRLLGDLFGFIDVDGTDDLFDLRDVLWRHA